MGERLHKYLARCGVGSRRECEKLIVEQRVIVNGKVVNTPGRILDPEKDYVTCDGVKVKHQKFKTVMIMVNKPKKCLSTKKDPLGRDIIYNLVPSQYRHLCHVGRLDYNSEGLIFLTNDGELAHLLTKPSSSILKSYNVKVKGKPPVFKLKKLEKGIYLDGRKTLPVTVKFLRNSRSNTWYRLELFQGKYRQIRRMFQQINHPVLKLKRIAFGPIELGKLPTGNWRLLTTAEIKSLRNSLKPISQTSGKIKSRKSSVFFRRKSSFQ